MRNLILFLLFFYTLNQSFASNDTYQEVMKQNIQNLYEAKDKESLQEVANKFEVIAKRHKDEWLPLYYASYVHIIMSNMEEQKNIKDQNLDVAQEFLDKALLIQMPNSEIVALQGFLHMMRLSIDPGARGQQLAPLASQNLQKAVNMDPSNPRALFLLGQMNYGTAQFFNSDTREACSLISKSVEKFESYKSENEIAPDWGKNWAASMLEECQGTAKK